jgi:hypothetical protein
MAHGCDFFVLRIDRFSASSPSLHQKYKEAMVLLSAMGAVFVVGLVCVLFYLKSNG